MTDPGASERTQKYRSDTSGVSVVSAYDSGERDFRKAQLDGADLRGADLRGATFYGASMRKVRLDRAILTHVQLKGADLTGASLRRAWVNATDLIGAVFGNACLAGADLTGAALQDADCTNADLTDTNLGNARLNRSSFDGADVSGAHIARTSFADTDMSTFCESRFLNHGGPSHIDARAVIKTYPHSRLKEYMIDCGVPPIFAEYMIDCAQASSDGALRTLMRSTFISYGGPDEDVARRIYEVLREHQVMAFFFPETARLGARIDSEIFTQIARHDRVVLLCSEESLDRPGVLHEIRETLDRESRDGGETYLLPVTLDDYLFAGWKSQHPELAQRLARRVVGDFRKVRESDDAFQRGMTKLLGALKKAGP